jgi:serine/threonine-protein kinase
MKSLGDVSAGYTLGRYELLVPIAQGGMAVVWAARMKGTRGFSKTVAVKCMLPSLSDDPQFEDMFLAEAELASRIRHPNVCEILDLGEQEGLLYIVMEWVDGEPLSTLQRAARGHGGIPLSVATRIALSAASGLHAAHELRDEAGELVGLVHRDVSPQNVLVTYDGVVKIVDFGVAKATSQNEGTHTRAGQVKGKIPFMSPEQAMGKTVDRRTDVFALGIVLFQMITGKHPFRGDNDMATLHKICEREPVTTVSSLMPACPAGLSAAIAQALEKDVDKRFETMLDFVRALERALAELTASGQDSDVGTFTRGVLGERATKRRAAMKEALRIVDEQGKSGSFVFDRPSLTDPSSVSAGSTAVELPNTVVSGRASPSSASAPDSVGLPVPIPAKGAKRRMLAVGLLGGVLSLLGVAAVVAIRSRPVAPTAQSVSPVDSAMVHVAASPHPSIATGQDVTLDAATPDAPIDRADDDGGTDGAAEVGAVGAQFAGEDAGPRDAGARPITSAEPTEPGRGPTPRGASSVEPAPAATAAPAAPMPGGGVYNPGF